MKIFTVDLYKEFGVERKENERKGFLKCCLLEQTGEICAERRHPAMLVIPGGGYVHTSAREAEPVALKYTAENYNAFILDYSCNEAKYPSAFREAAMAMCYIRKNADALFVNPDCVAAVGFSAGGHLLGCISILHKSEELNFLGECKSFVRPDASLFIYPVVTSGKSAHRGSFDSLCGNNEELKKFLSLENRVDKDSAPAFIVSTFNDGCVPVKNSLLLADAYENSGVPFTVHIFEKGQHGLSVADETAYGKKAYQGVMESTSSDFHKWVKLSVRWLKDRGFEIIDR